MGDLLTDITTTRLCRVLDAAGFTMARVRGRHGAYHHPDGRRVTVPLYMRRIVPPDTLKAILRDAGIGEEEFERLLG